MSLLEKNKNSWKSVLFTGFADANRDNQQRWSSWSLSVVCKAQAYQTVRQQKSGSLQLSGGGGGAGVTEPCQTMKTMKMNICQTVQKCY